MSGTDLRKIQAEIAGKKLLNLGKKELYPHIEQFSDAALQVRAIVIATADKVGCDEEKLWKWVLRQLED